jgi:hypothetical protein
MGGEVIFVFLPSHQSYGVKQFIISKMEVVGFFETSEELYYSK